MSDLWPGDLNQPLKHAAEKIPQNYEKYLSESKLRNQKLREINEKEIKKRVKDGGREEGFRVYFSGANKEVVAEGRRGGGSKTTRSERERGVEERGATAPSRTRRKWGGATKVGVLTERGERVFVRPSEYYSEDFEGENDEGESRGEDRGRSTAESRAGDRGRSTGESRGEERGWSTGESRTGDRGRSTEESHAGDRGRSTGESRAGDRGRSTEESRGEERGRSTGESRGEERGRSTGESRAGDRGRSTGESRGEERGRSTEESRTGDRGRSTEESRGEEKGRSVHDFKYDVEDCDEIRPFEKRGSNDEVYGRENNNKNKGRVEEIEEEIFEDIQMDLSLNEMYVLRQSLVIQKRSNDSNINELFLNKEKNLNITRENILVENENYNDSRLRQIIDKVSQMSAEQQKRLLNSLETIVEKCEDVKKTITLTIVIESNWGHERKVGMTEIAFWSYKKEPLKIINVKEDQGIYGSTILSRLIDGKTNTSKENHMWSCNLSLNNIIKIDCEVEILSLEDVKYFVIWNYNMSLDSLCIGVKGISLWAGETIIIRSIVEKALGNAAFNPPTILEIESEIKKQDNSLEAPLDFSSDDECLLDKLLNVQNKTFRTENKDLNSSRKNSARFGRRSEMENVENRDQLKELVEQFEKDTLMNKKSILLEKSWTSLSYFNKSHAGRLSIDQSNDNFNIYSNRLLEANDIETEMDEEFVIPELPIGKTLNLNILTTWGDPHYVGLTGLEMFAASGERIKIRRISADPPDVNILPGYGDDPRVVGNLLDGVNKTRDDVHMWLTPFTFSQNHIITVEFVTAVPLAFLRLWNYNKSRIHSSRGAREVEICLDKLVIFKGEIGRDEEVGEVILFTNDDQILDLIGQNDEEFISIEENIEDVEQSEISTANELLASIALRPLTAKETTNEEEKDDHKQTYSIQTAVVRPFTSTKNLKSEKALTTVIRLMITETWSDQTYVGLTGIQFINDCGELIPIDMDNITSNISPLMNNESTLVKILDGYNVTDDHDHMWLAPFSGNDKEHFINVTFSKPQRLSSIRIWNYNKSVEESYRGVKVLHVTLDSQRISPESGYLLRRAPGHVLYDFVQEIFVESQQSNNITICNRDLPCGFIIQINLYSAWNDVYYVGLNGIELYDHLYNRIEVGRHQVFAYPDSVNALTPKIQQTSQTFDVRTPDKLVNSLNDTYDPKNMWLAPILPGSINKIFLVFDYPVSISMIRLWNYSKTPARGVKDFSVMIDDLLIYSGVLPIAVSASISRGILPHMNDLLLPTNQHHTILFEQTNVNILSSEKGHILHNDNQSQAQEVVFINDNIYSKETMKQPTNQIFRPTTSVNRDKNKWKAHG